MVSIHQSMPSALRSNMPAIIVPREPSPRVGVAFHSNPVQDICRPTSEKENSALYDFEYHARSCPDCHHPYKVYKEHHRLCPTGHQFAQDVAIYLYNVDGETYSACDAYMRVRVEVPTSFVETRELLKAMEKSLKSRSRSNFVSLDRSYYVQPRAPKRSHTVKVEQSRRPKSMIVDWPEEQKHVTVAAGSSKRGSLYDADIEQRRRDYAKYNVEVREPKNRSSGYHQLGYYR